MATLHGTTVDADLGGITFEEAIEHLRYKSSLCVHVNWDAIEMMAIDRDQSLDLRLGEVSLADLLDEILKEAGAGETHLGYEVVTAILISTRGALPERNVKAKTTEYNDYTEGLESRRRTKYRIKPTKDPDSEKGLYIPRDLEDCFVELKKMLHPSLIDEIKTGTENDMVDHHFGLGMWMRNYWRLWGGSRLGEYFNSLGISHPDDMSSIVLDSFWRHLNSEPIMLDEQVEYYQEYWRQAAMKQQSMDLHDSDRVEAGEDELEEEADHEEEDEEGDEEEEDHDRQ
jgi:hypothetical protein